MKISKMQARLNAKKNAKTELVHANFFYSPTESKNNVLAIQFGQQDNQLPIELVAHVTSPEFVKLQDAEYAMDLSMVADYFEQLDYMLAKVNLSNKSHIMSQDEMRYLIAMAGNIYWLTQRGFIKQSEYNGTQFYRMMVEEI